MVGRGTLWPKGKGRCGQEEQKPLAEDQAMTLVTTGRITLPSQENTQTSQSLTYPCSSPSSHRLLPPGKTRRGEDTTV